MKKGTVKPGLTFADYIDTYDESYRTMNMYRSWGHQVYTLECQKKAISADDDKRYILLDGINTIVHVHYKIE